MTIDLFNSDTKSTGNLTGQDGWSGATQFQVQNSVVQEGDQAVSVTGSAAAYDIALSITPDGDLDVTVQLQAGSGFAGEGDAIRVNFYEGAAHISTASLEFTGGSLNTKINGVKVSGKNTGQWYKMQLQFRTSDNTVRWQVDDGGYGAYTATFEAFTSIDTIKLGGSFSSGAKTGYVDSITKAPYTVGPINLKTWNGLATASIKTMNGLAMASVKTWNGLT